jgi:hypothetical protein
MVEVRCQKCFDCGTGWNQKLLGCWLAARKVKYVQLQWLQVRDQMDVQAPGGWKDCLHYLQREPADLLRPAYAAPLASAAGCQVVRYLVQI